ncbi:MAG: potassium channel family protein [Phycisphaerales bacterium]
MFERLFKPIEIDPALKRALSVCTLVIMFGTAGFTWIEGWGIWQSFFFTLYTLTTVGYGDNGISESGQRFTAILMIGGIASVSYSLSQIVQYATSKAIDKEKHMINKAKKMNDHVIVCGIGRTGIRVIQRLQEQSIPLVATDTDKDLVERARDQDIVAFLGDSTLDHVLIDAGITRASAIAATTSSDSTNAMICLSAKALNPTIRIIARAEADDSVEKLTRAGADSVINPSRFGGDGIAESILHPCVAEVVFGTHTDPVEKLHFRELPIDQGSKYEGRELSELLSNHPAVVLISIRETGGHFTMRPPGTHVLNAGEFLLVAGLDADVAKLEGCHYLEKCKAA